MKRFDRVLQAICVVAAILWAPMIQNFHSILEGITKLQAYLAPSVTAVFLWGVFWRGASKTSAIASLAGGAVLGAILCPLDLFNIWTVHDSFFMGSVYLILLCSAVLVVRSGRVMR